MVDVVIAGGGIMGCATAVFLLREDPSLTVVVVEPDPGYGRAATPLATGGVRQLFSCPENIQLSRFTLEVIDDWEAFASVEGAPPPDLGWRPQGYLFIVGPEAVGVLADNLEVQLRLGVDARWLERGELADLHPQLRTDDLGAAVLSPDDGWLDPYAFLLGLRDLARGLGATFLTDEVVDLPVEGTAVRSVVLAGGARLQPDAVVVTAGVHSAALAARVGLRLPVEPMPRLEHHVEVPVDLAGLPFVKDPANLAVRPEGEGLSVGVVDHHVPASLELTVDHDHFPTTVWPALAHRFPALDRLRLRSTWAGLYQRNTLDRNAIVGNWPGTLDNLYVACGFSGHGMMHAPGIGRGLAELILHGRYRTLDLSRLGYERVVEGRPYAERGII